MRTRGHWSWCVLSGIMLFGAGTAGADELDKAIATLQAVGPKGEKAVEAAAAWQVAAGQGPQAVPRLLEALDSANPLAANYLRAAAETIAERALREGAPLSAKELEAFLADTSHNGRARRMAYEWLCKLDPTAPKRLVPTFLNDPAVELRRDAVQRLIDLAADAADEARRRETYQQAFAAARDTDQVKLLTDKLKELGVEVNLPRHFGFILRWKLLGPFDNVGQKGYHVAYPPEIAVEYETSYVGKEPDKKLQWVDHLSKDDYGYVDLNEALGKHMGAVAYAATEFLSEEETPAEFRLGSDCAVKLWLNGQLLDAREIYHQGHAMDQYISSGTLRKGRNQILVKVCQNEQTESWAQDWKFQLRVCNSTGTAILSTDRPADQ